MKQATYFFFGCSLFIFTAFTIQNSINWKISKDYQVKFSGTDAEGIFKKLSGDIQFDEKNIDSAHCNLTIDVNSINTGNGMKNKHALSDNWFAAEKYPTIEFSSKLFSKSENGYTVTGVLKIHCIEKEITIPFYIVFYLLGALGSLIGIIALFGSNIVLSFSETISVISFLLFFQLFWRLIFEFYVVVFNFLKR